MKINKKIRKIFNLYNLAIFICVVLILVSAYVMLKPEKQETPSGVEVVQSDVGETEEITENEARKVAKKQFKKLGEKNVKEENLQIRKIERSGEEYYYISSAENTMEIQIKSGKVTRINSATVEE